jgi:hypothetical protein
MDRLETWSLVRDCFEIDLEKAGWGGLDWIYLAQSNDQRQDVVRMVTNFALL